MESMMMNDKMSEMMPNGCKNQRYMKIQEMKEIPKMKDKGMDDEGMNDKKKMDKKEMPKK